MTTLTEGRRQTAEREGMSVEDWQKEAKRRAKNIPDNFDLEHKLIVEGKYPYYYPFFNEVIEGKTVKEWYDCHGLVLPTKDKEGIIKKVERVPHPETNVVTKTQFNNKYYNRIEAGIFNNPKKSIQSPTLLLLYLLLHRAWKDKKDRHNTWTYWYVEKNLIVASRGEEQMALDLGVHIKTVRNWSRALEDDELIIKHIENRENVYVLGCIKDGKELYLYSGGTTRKDLACEI